MKLRHVVTAIRGSAFIVEAGKRFERHRTALGLLVVGVSLVTVGGVLAGRELTTTEVTIVQGEQAAPSRASESAPAPAQTGTSSLVNINTAGLAELDRLPGIGPKTAQKIIDYRTSRGPFGSVAEIDNVPGIGPATYGKIKDLIAVE